MAPSAEIGDIGSSSSQFLVLKLEILTVVVCDSRVLTGQAPWCCKLLVPMQVRAPEFRVSAQLSMLMNIVVIH